ncbi:hypothetical protein INT47_006210 [Mucor saturninus]|uniref:Uncharacterized protein n=1 Tax=Mucor saturninus TaxID=64648 RepID=A0A8H7QDF0_9FUNG|nr:hypothetical protein INT47_006210 [Mucor saturninus]
MLKFGIMLDKLSDIGVAGRRSQCLSHAKRALYHLSYNPRLVRWRLGRFTAMERNECPCADFGQIITRDHFLTCRAIDADLIDSLPVSPPGVNRIDFALNSLPTKKHHKPPAFWPNLLSLLWMIDTLCHPLSNIPEDPHPGSSWFNYPR